MRRRLAATLTLVLMLCSPALAAPPKAVPVKAVAAKLALAMQKDASLQYQGPGAAAFPDGLPPCAVLGLSFAPAGQDKILFVAATGRGPNADGPKYLDKPGAKAQAGRFFAVPDFGPGLAFVETGADGATLSKTVPLSYEGGKPISGRPVPAGQPGATGELALAEDLGIIQGDPLGLSPQAAAYAKNGAVWIADDYGPFLVLADADSGRILERLGPGEGLPEILTLRQDNKGFSGVAVAQSGKVTLCLRGVLAVDAAARDSKAAFIRLVEYDPASRRTRMFAYPIGRSGFRRPFDAQLCGLAVTGEGRLFVLEQGKDKNGRDRTLVCLADVSAATDISGLRAANGAPLETAGEEKDLEAMGVVFAKRSVALDLRAAGIGEGALSGLAVSPDGDSLYVAQPGDGGLASTVENPVVGESGQVVKNPGFYTFDAKKRIWYVNQTVQAKFALKPSAQAPAIWRVSLPEPLK